MTQLHTVRGVATSIVGRAGKTEVVYHGTPVVTFDDMRIKLDTGGWRTATTKTRMNQTANQFGLGFHVSQEDHKWSVRYRGQDIAFPGNTLILER